MDKMSFKDRTFCNRLRKALVKKNPSDYEVWEKVLMAAGKEPCDGTDNEYLKAVVERFKNAC